MDLTELSALIRPFSPLIRDIPSAGLFTPLRFTKDGMVETGNGSQSAAAIVKNTKVPDLVVSASVVFSVFKGISSGEAEITSSGIKWSANGTSGIIKPIKTPVKVDWPSEEPKAKFPISSELLEGLGWIGVVPAIGLYSGVITTRFMDGLCMCVLGSDRFYMVCMTGVDWPKGLCVSIPEVFLRAIGEVKEPIELTVGENSLTAETEEGLILSTSLGKGPSDAEVQAVLKSIVLDAEKIKVSDDLRKFCGQASDLSSGTAMESMMTIASENGKLMLDCDLPATRLQHSFLTQTELSSPIKFDVRLLRRELTSSSVGAGWADYFSFIETDPQKPKIQFLTQYSSYFKVAIFGAGPAYMPKKAA
jgi:hypothetical protein